MRARPLPLVRHALPAALVVLALLAACSDPVPDGAISALGDENPTIPVGEYHRAGQPCVLCHDSSGPASDKPFAVAGTVFAQPNNAEGVDQATVAMTDTMGSVFTVKTNCVGNFFVPRGAWDPAFPIFVRVFKDGTTRTMQGQVGRERSCANCHKDALTQSDQLTSKGHVYLYEDGDAVPPNTDCPVNPVVGGN